ncbi:MAG: glycosyltransferase [Rhodococcus sp.]|nr:glycosyltransferase [Rhodococcus sp. (in: high G+C Gram-positive bacteria)]
MVFGTTVSDVTVKAAAAISGLGFVVTAVNAASTPRLTPGATPRTFDEPVTVVVPARNERLRISALLEDLRAQTGVARLRVYVYDDNSTDGTSDVAEQSCAGDLRFVVVRGSTEPPPGWLGKPAACVAALGAEMDIPEAGMVVFLDADVRLHRNALAVACHDARLRGVELLSPWPYQRAQSWPERMVQPLLAWSWASTLPTAFANRDSRGSTVVACGQFLVFDAEAYRAVGGHRSVATSVTEDLDIARVMRRSGFRTAVVAAGRYAECRMYDGAQSLWEGYGRWLWTAFGTPTGAVAASAAAVLAYVVPPTAMIAGRGPIRRWAFAAYAAATGSRLLARSLEKGARPRATDVFDAAAHPVSILAAISLTAASHCAHRRGRAQWKGRSLS